MKNRRALLTSATALAALFLVSTTEGWAQSIAQTDSAIRAYWTPERLKNAKPKVLLSTADAPTAQADAALPLSNRGLQAVLPTRSVMCRVT